ncbi:MAG: carboxypeptidase regulatory-like domain-containing protein [Burkholderiales bacterium]|nr:carboxypeptidase regulatory-like domain-containing protein [Burkholderiales bacterium]
MNNFFGGNAASRRWMVALFGVSALAFFLVTTPAAAQTSPESKGAARSSVAVNFGESFAVRDLPPVKMGFSKKRLATDPYYEEKNASNKKPIRTYDVNAIATPDAALWSESVARYGRVPSAPAGPSVQFDGISSADTVTLGQGYLPPDTTGAVGPTQYVQAVNSAFRVWDRAGNPLTAPATLSALFATLPGACATTNDGDPIVLYDQLADRWLISQFCTLADPNNHQLIAISKTGDATGAYYLYDFAMPNNKFNDYPHFGMWPDGYYMTDNQFNQAGTAFQGAGAFAFNRAKMLAGDPTANFVYFDMDTIVPGAGGVLPASVDGFTPPPAGAPAPFAYFEANEYGDPGDRLRIFDFHADFTTPANSTFTERVGSPLTVAAFDPREIPSGSRNIVPQPGQAASRWLDVISDRLMYRLAYRNLGTSETLIANHSVNAATAPAFRAGVRFYQLSRASAAAPFTITEQQTFDNGVADTEHRWMASAAINHQGDIAVGYSVSSATVSPSIRYAAKFGTDAPGSGLAQGEQTIQVGAGQQTSTSGRWGDYSQMSIDPVDDCTFWYTQEYYAATSGGGWRTHIAKFAPRACATSPRGTISGTITNCASGLPAANVTVSTAVGGYSRGTIVDGTYSMTVVPGTYTVSAQSPSYGTTATSPTLTVTNGGTATFNGCLVGVPVIQAVASATVIAENAVLLNNAPDPGETLTLSVPLRNIGTGDTTSLVAAMQVSGGVTAPSAPQNYGTVVAGGATVSRPFTFTASGACGANITPTLGLQDGATNLGTIAYALRLGTVNGVTFANPAAITIPSLGAASLYPSTINVSGFTGTVGKITVKLKGFSHTYPRDVDMLLVSPTGQKLIILSDVGATSVAAVNATITLDDAAANLLPTTTGIVSGAFKPTNVGASDPFAGAPAAPYANAAPGGAATMLGTFGTTPTDVNGAWSLYVLDDEAGDQGTINGGWEISITRIPADLCAIPRALDVDLNGAYEAPFDGQMIVRYLLGVRGAALTVSSIGATPTRSDPNVVLTHLDNIRPLLDVDGNGQVDPFTDGLMILRFMLGMNGAAMTQGAIGSSPTRTVSEMTTYMQNITPVTPAP